MYKEVLSGIEHISVYPVFSFSVFFVFFLMVTIWVIISHKEDFDNISRLPLDNKSEIN